LRTRRAAKWRGVLPRKLATEGWAPLAKRSEAMLSNELKSPVKEKKIEPRLLFDSNMKGGVALAVASVEVLEVLL
jgi:hypothetical protein